MTSINTNVAALNALNSLDRTQSRLQEAQERISTGLRVRDSKNNPSAFAIAQSLRSQVHTFATVTESLSLAQSTLATAVAATGTINALVEDIKANIVQAQNDNVDRLAIQAEIDQLVAQIDSQIDTAAFNGSNLINGSTDPFNVLVGVTNVGPGDAPDFISFNRFDLRAAGAATNSLLASTFNGDLIPSRLFLEEPFEPGDVNRIVVDLRDTSVVPATTVALDITIDPLDNLDGVAAAVETAIRDVGTGDFPSVTVTADAFDGTQLIFSNTSGSEIEFVRADFAFSGGALSALAAIDVTTSDRAEAALAEIDGLADQVRDTNQALGSQQRRLELQDAFVATLVGNLESGLGAIVDADIAEESVNLSQEQVRQELSVQSLGIANQNARILLQLFRN